MPNEPYCDLCDLPLAFCSHGRAATAASAPDDAPSIPGSRPAATVSASATPSGPTPAASGADTPAAPDTRAAEPVRRPSVPGFLEVSPEQVAHFPGCPDRGEDVDYDAWGLVTRATGLAWRELGEGTPVPCDSGPRSSLVALSRCATCDGHGPWL